VKLAEPALKITFVDSNGKSREYIMMAKDMAQSTAKAHIIEFFSRSI